MNTPRFLQRLALNIWNSKRRYDKFMCGASTASGHSKSENLVIVMNSASKLAIASVQWQIIIPV